MKLCPIYNYGKYPDLPNSVMLEFLIYAIEYKILGFHPFIITKTSSEERYNYINNPSFKMVVDYIYSFYKEMLVKQDYSISIPFDFKNIEKKLLENSFIQCYTLFSN